MKHICIVCTYIYHIYTKKQMPFKTLMDSEVY